MEAYVRSLMDVYHGSGYGGFGSGYVSPESFLRDAGVPEWMIGVATAMESSGPVDRDPQPWFAGFPSMPLRRDPRRETVEEFEAYKASLRVKAKAYGEELIAWVEAVPGRKAGIHGSWVKWVFPDGIEALRSRFDVEKDGDGSGMFLRFSKKSA